MIIQVILCTKHNYECRILITPEYRDGVQYESQVLSCMKIWVWNEGLNHSICVSTEVLSRWPLTEGYFLLLNFLSILAHDTGALCRPSCRFDYFLLPLIPLFPRFFSWDTTIKWATFCITSDKKGTKVWEGRRRPSRKDHGVVKNTHDFSWGQKKQ